MKNLFKNLMLVAVAAMAFTACTETNDEVNAVSKTTRYEFTANIAEETRSGFAEKEEGATAYKSEWFGDEYLKVYVTDYAYFTGSYTTSIEEDGKFVLDLADAPESFFITILSPAESWVDENTYNIPAEQTPLANSVDPAAHLLQAQAVPVNNGVADINMIHMAAYGKMTVNGVDFAIDHVVVDLKGSYYGYDRELSYTINATNVENNTFWFATEPIDVAEFTVKAYGAGDKVVAKTVDVAAAGKTMSFQYGHVGTFSVSGLEEYVEPEETYDSTYAYIYEDYGDTDKMFMFVAEDGRGLRIDFVNVYENNCIVPGTYTFTGNSRMWPGWCYYHADATGSYTSKLDGGQAVVSVEDGQYKIVFTNMSYDSTVYVEQFTFKGQINGLDVPDPRVKLATPEVDYTVNDKVVELTWGSDANAEYFLVTCDSESVEDITTTETSATITLPEYGTYSFSVAAKVADNNENYRSSNPAEFSIYVADPSAWADYEADVIANEDSYIQLRDANWDVFNVSIKLNSADRIVNNGKKSILLGDYTFTKNENPNPGEFYINFYAILEPYSYVYGSNVFSASLSVEEENGEYKILLTIDGIRFGFKGISNLGDPITAATIIPAKDSVKFKPEGGEVTVNLTTVLTTEDVTASSDNDQFSASVSGNVLTISAKENTVAEDVTGTVTLVSGTAIATVSVLQSAAGTASLDNVFTQCKYVMMHDMGQGWGRRYELTNEDGLYMDLWVDQPAADQNTGKMVADTYGYQSAWCDYDPNDRGFVVKTIYLPSVGDYVGITNATMNVTLSGDVHNITFEFTFESGDTETFTFSGTITKGF